MLNRLCPTCAPWGRKVNGTHLCTLSFDKFLCSEHRHQENCCTPANEQKISSRIALEPEEGMERYYWSQNMRLWFPRSNHREEIGFAFNEEGEAVLRWAASRDLWEKIESYPSVPEKPREGEVEMIVKLFL